MLFAYRPGAFILLQPGARDADACAEWARRASAAVAAAAIPHGNSIEANTVTIRTEPSHGAGNDLAHLIVQVTKHHQNPIAGGSMNRPLVCAALLAAALPLAPAQAQSMPPADALSAPADGQAKSNQIIATFYYSNSTQGFDADGHTIDIPDYGKTEPLRPRRDPRRRTPDAPAETQFARRIGRGSRGQFRG